MDFLIYAILAVYIICSLLLVLVVLIQRPKSEGLGTAFGGGITDSVFGAQTSDVLTKATVWLGSIFFICTLTLAILYSKKASNSAFEQELAAKQPPVEEKVEVPAPVPVPSSQKTTQEKEDAAAKAKVEPEASTDAAQQPKQDTK